MSTLVPLDRSVAVALLDQSVTVVLLDQSVTVSLFDKSATVALLNQSATVSLLDQSVTVSLLDQSVTVGPIEQSVAPMADLISADTAKLIEAVVQAGILPVVVLVGVVLNLISMAVFWRQGFGDRVSVCLFSLAVSDSGYLLSIYSTRVHSLFTLVDRSLGQYWKSRGLLMVGFYTGFLNVSNVLTLLISLDRCACVAMPLKAKNLLSPRHTRVVVALVFAVCLCSCGLAGFKYDTVTYVDPATNATRYRSILTPFYLRNRDVVDGLYQYTFNVAVPTVSLFGVMVATSVIAVRMRDTLTWRKRTTQVSSTASMADSREAAVTRLLIMVCVIYTISTIPTVTLSFVRNLVPGFIPGGRFFRAFDVSHCLMHLLSSVNSSVNFIIYYSMGTRFRATFKGVVASTVLLCVRRRERVSETVAGKGKTSDSVGVISVTSHTTVSNN